MKAKLILLTVSLLSASLLVGCAKSPSGRQQLTLFSNSEMKQLGTQSFEQMKKEIPLSRDKKLNQYVQCVATHITAQVEKGYAIKTWEVVVFDSDQVNAFALPGGKIGVYRGLLNVATTQDQLASVIGHEVAHVLSEHGNERMSHAQLANAGLAVADVFSKESEYGGVAMSALGLGVQYGVLLPFSRTHESEADLFGLALMAKAGFDPRAAVQLWKNMAKASSGENPAEILSTHPSHKTRIDDLNAAMPTALKLQKQANSRPHCK
ncbi:M48 family metallopeptidase [Psychromonas hadalis]|uniref:M48 family metallopeptidase n=1 Tax=Psychromonas hadalis TaxID=211669 RepID=UPI0003B4DF73|nr:M48 family metallopeptidase [Psychromonas hadalis]